MRAMTDNERHEFMLGRARTAILATTRGDGWPHVAPVWFDLDGDTLIFMTGEDTLKGRNLRRDSRVSLCVDDEEPPFAFVVIEGAAAATLEDPEMLHWATRIGGRYMGEERADEFGTRNATPSELLVRVTPTKMLAFTEISE